jgi:CDP-diacylglycerol--serine O-phosphatidyltransferase
MNWRAAIPNALTLGNLACGVLAIMLELAFRSSSVELPNQVSISFTPFDWLFRSQFRPWMLIPLAALFDVLDGAVARWLRSESKMGVQLDSLADLVSFGVAPAVLLMKPLLESSKLMGLPIPGELLPSNPIFSHVALVCLVAVSIASAFRLARFNLSEGPTTDHFEGLPTPASGLLLVTLLGLLLKDESAPVLMSGSVTLLIATTSALLALAMVSRWPFLSFKGSTKEKLALVAVFAAGVLLAWLTEWQPWVVLATLALYAVVSRVLIPPVRRAAQ